MIFEDKKINLYINIILWFIINLSILIIANVNEPQFSNTSNFLFWMFFLVGALLILFVYNTIIMLQNQQQ
jgi:hypothetical protein